MFSCPECAVRTKCRATRAAGGTINRAEHYQRAEQLAEQAAGRIQEGAEADADRLIALAQVHATLAASADSAALATAIATAAAAAAVSATGRRDFAEPAPATRNTRSRKSKSIAVRDLAKFPPDIRSHPGDEQA